MYEQVGQRPFYTGKEIFDVIEFDFEGYVEVGSPSLAQMCTDGSRGREPWKSTGSFIIRR